ncbi:MAG TPA: polysaccharide biosynthesis protein [Candidatus Sericytochromatia bacterium]
MKPESDLSVVSPTRKAEIIKRIQQVVPPGSPEPQDPEVLVTLQTLTADLIEAYKAEGQLQEDPFGDVRSRSIHLYESEVASQLKGKVVLVTGGEGCVGSDLVKKLVELGVQRVVSVDKARVADSLDAKPIGKKEEAITLYAADVRHYEALNYIFDVEKPEIVFHLAAQRLPGLAEIQVRETIATSILGTENIIQLCESYGVQQCIFSSTGKASRYFTNEVYAASKKLAEWQFAKAVQTGKVTYGMVRFTHTLDNSAACEQINGKIQEGKIVNVHAPHRYLTAQNLNEARHLLLNGLIFAQPGQLKFLTVRNLGWPTETLEMSLYNIVASGKNLPIYFQGLPPGYEEPFFLGQFDYSNPTEIHLLINTLEDPSRQSDSSRDMIIAELAPFSIDILDKHISALKTLVADLDLPEAQLKPCLGEAVREITKSIFSKASPQALLKILKWGINPKQVKAKEISIESHRDVLELLAQGLYGRLNQAALEASSVTFDEFGDLVESLSTLPGIQKEVTYLKALGRQIKQSELSQNQGVEDVKEAALLGKD